jgi:SEC-C motif
MHSPSEIHIPSDDDALIELIETLGDTTSRELITVAAARGDEMEAKLVAIIKDEECWYDDVEDAGYWLPLHAVMILGLRESETAGLALADALQMCTRSASDLGDWFAGFWPALLRNKPDSVARAFQTLFRTRADNEYCRIVSADVLTAIAQRRGPTFLDSMLSQIAGVVADQSETLVFRQYMATLLLDFPRAEYRQLIDSMADIKSELGVMYSISDVESAFDETQDSPEWEQFADPWEFYSEEAITRRAEQSLEDDDQDDDVSDDDDEEQFVETVVYSSPKVGRNDPCPCGSGKKYKQCCLLNE